MKSLNHKIISLPRRRVILRVCPGCSHTITQLQADMAKFDFNCVKCKNYKISEFLPIQSELNEIP